MRAGGPDFGRGGRKDGRTESWRWGTVDLPSFRRSVFPSVPPPSPGSTPRGARAAPPARQTFPAGVVHPEGRLATREGDFAERHPDAVRSLDVDLAGIGEDAAVGCRTERRKVVGGGRRPFRPPSFRPSALTARVAMTLLLARRSAGRATRAGRPRSLRRCEPGQVPRVRLNRAEGAGTQRRQPGKPCGAPALRDRKR